MKDIKLSRILLLATALFAGWQMAVDIEGASILIMIVCTLGFGGLPLSFLKAGKPFPFREQFLKSCPIYRW